MEPKVMARAEVVDLPHTLDKVVQHVLSFLIRL